MSFSSFQNTTGIFKFRSQNIEYFDFFWFFQNINESSFCIVSVEGICSTPLLTKRLLDEYRTQSRGGVGAKGVKTKDDDFNEHLFIASTHNYLLIFTEFGKVFWKKVWEIPEGSKVSKGRAIQNLINIESGDTIRSVINIDNLTDEDYLNNNYRGSNIIRKTASGDFVSSFGWLVYHNLII